LTVAEEQLSSMREEMATATTNYEGQLAMMSEHVANMNDKLTRQTDEIDGLRYEVNQAKRGKK
jgi:protein phosphatase 1 regulatory subunit 21